jgi:hypothetical protein
MAPLDTPESSKFTIKVSVKPDSKHRKGKADRVKKSESN